MNRSYAAKAALAGLAILFGLSAPASAEINDAVVITRVFDDCPTSNLTYDENYSSQIWIEESALTCGGFANLHIWRLSENGLDPGNFMNDAGFRVGADLQVSGEGEGEAGLQISPWWSTTSEGRFNVRTTDGEIAVFGGRLPYYSFTANHGVTYAKGDMVHLEMAYRPNDLSSLNPGTIEYTLTLNGTDYASGAIPFDEGNPEEGRGSWGILDNAQVGGHVQTFLNTEGAEEDMVRVDWSNIEFELFAQGEEGACCLESGECLVTMNSDACTEQGGEWQGSGTSCDPNPCEMVPTETTTWGQIKSGFSGR